MGKIRHLSDCIDDIIDQIAEIEAAGFSADNAIKIVSAATELQRNEGLCEIAYLFDCFSQNISTEDRYAGALGDIAYSFSNIVKELHEFNLCACSVNAHGEIACPPTIHVKKV